jgi:hypothetical protein
VALTIAAMMRGDRNAIVAAFDPLSQAATWVFLCGLDVEARHIIFASELARANRIDQTFTETVTRALDSAKATYEAHVQSSSRETLKALGELRKTVIEETQKVTQKTQDLTVALWRDLAVTAAPFVLKALGDAGRVTSPTIATGFYFGAAAFITLSFVLQWRINGAYFKSQTDTRAAWLQTLYNYISPRERNEIADTPIVDAMKNYRDACNPAFDLCAPRRSPHRLRHLHPSTRPGRCAIPIPTNRKASGTFKADDLTREANLSGLCAFGQSPVPQGRSLADAKKRRHRRRDRGHAGDATTIDHTTWRSVKFPPHWYRRK